MPYSVARAPAGAQHLKRASRRQACIRTTLSSRALVAAFAFALVFAARPVCAKEELVIGTTQFPSTFHPSIDSMLAKTYILAMARRPLTMHDARWELGCMICVQLPTIANGGAVPEKTPDGKQGVAVTFTLLPGLKWGDGTPLTSRDVAFTWEVGRHPLTGVSNQEFYRSLYRVDAKNESTFTLHFDKLTFDYNAVNDMGLLPAHLEEKPFRADPAAYKNRTLYDTATVNPGLYYGPYRVTEVTAGSHVVLVPNAHWVGSKPHFKRVVVRTIENTAALEANLLSGAIDMIAGELGLTVDQGVAFAKRHGQRFNVIFKPSLVYEHLEPNLDNPILKDLRVRRALLHALDRDTIVRQLFDGHQPVAHTGINPLDWIYHPEVKTYPYDPKLAAALLDEAGWSVVRGGVRHNANGERLAIELATTAGNRTRESVQQVLQSQWRAVGVDARIRNQPARVFFGETVRKRTFPGFAMFAWYSAPENVPRTILHSSHIPAEANNFAGQNYAGYVNPEMDRLIDAIEVELDRDKRRALWKQFQDLYADDLPALPLFFRADAFVLPKWLAGVEPTGHQGISTLWIENWRVRNP
ncbi:MAG: peptide ABC transporter substrate-binding protein [Rhodospirillales bacterium]|nr:peptide ABC transporter substrate-binding protein [Rhodospirillales bacterium]